MFAWILGTVQGQIYFGEDLLMWGRRSSSWSGVDDQQQQVAKVNIPGVAWGSREGGALVGDHKILGWKRLTRIKEAKLEEV